MTNHILRKCTALVTILAVLCITTGCHLLSSYTDEEVKSYIDKNFRAMPYTIERKDSATWTVVPGNLKDASFTIQETFHTSAGVVPQIDRILVNDIPEQTALPLLYKYLTKEEAAFVSIPEQTRIIKIDIPVRALKNRDVPYFIKRMSNFAAAYNQSYPPFANQITMRVHIIPDEGGPSLTDKEKAQLLDNMSTIQKSLLPKQAPSLYSLQTTADEMTKTEYPELYVFPQSKTDFEQLPALYKSTVKELNKGMPTDKKPVPLGFHGQLFLSKFR